MTREFALTIPTYVGGISEAVDFEDTNTKVLVQEGDGIRLVLGAHDINDYSVPDIQVERRRNGWCIFIHPEGGGDPSGYVYILDDGRSFVQQEYPGSSAPIEMLDLRDRFSEIDRASPPEGSEAT